WAIQNKSSRTTVFTLPIFRLASGRWPRASDRAATAAAMIITRWAGLRGRRRLSRLKCGQSISAKLQGQSRWSSRSTTRGKRRAPGHDHLAGQHGTRRYLKSVVGLRVALDMRAQLGDRAEPDRPVRSLGLDGCVGVKRIGHAVDDAGFEDRGCAAWLVERRGLRLAILHSLVRLALTRFDGRRWLGFGALGGTGIRGPHGIEILALGCGARWLRSEQKIEA